VDDVDDPDAVDDVGDGIAHCAAVCGCGNQRASASPLAR
jgi:hypothetical protein